MTIDSHTRRHKHNDMKKKAEEKMRKYSKGRIISIQKPTKVKNGF